MNAPATKKDWEDFQIKLSKDIEMNMHKHLESVKKHQAEDLEKLRVERKQDKEDFQKMISPMLETYKNVGTLGKWFMAFLVFITVLAAAIVGSKQILEAAKSVFK